VVYRGVCDRVEPCSGVEIKHIASLIGLPLDQVRGGEALGLVGGGGCLVALGRKEGAWRCSQIKNIYILSHCFLLVVFLQVEPKLSQMILDRKFQGTLDQGAGSLVVFADTEQDDLYPQPSKLSRTWGRSWTASSFGRRGSWPERKGGGRGGVFRVGGWLAGWLAGWCWGVGACGGGELQAVWGEGWSAGGGGRDLSYTSRTASTRFKRVRSQTAI